MVQSNSSRQASHQGEEQETTNQHGSGPASDSVNKGEADSKAQEAKAAAEESVVHSYGRYSLPILATIGVVHALYFARAILIPMALALVLYFLLAPLVRFLCRFRFVTESIAAGIVVIILGSTLGLASYFLTDPVSEWITDAPSTFSKAEQKLRFLTEPVDKIEDASEQVSKIASGSAKDDVVKVAIQQPAVTSYLLSSTFDFLAGATITIVLVYLLLAMGHRILNSIIGLITTIRDKRDFVIMIRNVEQGISRYLVTITSINICLGIIVGTILAVLDIPDPFLLGLMAAVLNFIPFVGPLAGAAIVFLIGVVHLSTPAEATIGPLLYVLINALEGNVVTPMILGRSMKLNPAIVFTCIVFWGWAWGGAGILLAVPLIGMLKISCDHFESLKPVSLVLSG